MLSLSLSLGSLDPSPELDDGATVLAAVEDATLYLTADGGHVVIAGLVSTQREVDGPTDLVVMHDLREEPGGLWGRGEVDEGSVRFQTARLRELGRVAHRVGARVSSDDQGHVVVYGWTDYAFDEALARTSGGALALCFGDCMGFLALSDVECHGASRRLYTRIEDVVGRVPVALATGEADAMRLTLDLYRPGGRAGLEGAALLPR